MPIQIIRNLQNEQRDPHRSMPFESCCDNSPYESGLPVAICRDNSTSKQPVKRSAYKSGFSLALSVLLLASTSIQAFTVLQFEHHREDAVITEGYSGDIDLLNKEASEVTYKARPKSSNGGNTGTGKETQSEQARSDNNTTAHEPFLFLSPQHLDHGNDVLFVSVGSSVYSDTDRDGFFTHFSVSFDADVNYGDRHVYARILLRADGEDYHLFHTSTSFDLYGHLSSDAYRIESKLVSNYPASLYDLRIELVDAYSDALLDVVDAGTHRTLFALPLESADQVDSASVFPAEYDEFGVSSQHPVDSEFRTEIVYEHVGAQFLLLPLLVFFGLCRRLSRIVQLTRPCTCRAAGKMAAER